jgi:ectoine hydroxylase-related dioxygenase (phytanoyl-CoA dioxygenase family)
MQGAVRVFGVHEHTRLNCEVDGYVEEIKLVGYTVVPGALDAAGLDAIRTSVDRIYQIQAAEIGGEARLEKINDAHTARALLAYDEIFLGVATNPKVLAIVERLLGGYYTLMLQNGVLNMPGVGDEQNAGSWHRDLNYQHFVSTRPLSVSALFCVDDFREETGGTHVLPASHKTEALPSDEFILAHERVIEAHAGSALVFDSMLFHCSGHNRSGRVRRALNHMYTLPFIKQQISLPKILNGKFRDDPFLGKFLGYDSESDESVIEFRSKRLGRLQPQ